MNKEELKKILKPLIKECIKEVMFEEGTLSTIISEVVKGTSGQSIVTETKQTVTDNQATERKRLRLQEQRRKMLDAIGKDSYNGVDLFEGTEPLTNREATSSGPKPGAVDLGDPGDAGVDISSLIGGATQVWKAIK